jgi:hypothetical protein
MNYQYPIRSNYGPLTDFSRTLNLTLGDQSGRTVSTRTAYGFINLFSTTGLDIEEAEHIVHGGMVAAGVLLKSKDQGAQVTGFLLSLTLFLCYHAGK